MSLSSYFTFLSYLYLVLIVAQPRVLIFLFYHVLLSYLNSGTVACLSFLILPNLTISLSCLTLTMAQPRVLLFLFYRIFLSLAYLYPNCGTAPCPSFLIWLYLLILPLSYVYPNYGTAPCPFCSYLTVSSYPYLVFILTVARPRVFLFLFDRIFLSLS